jgi:hypothetical protein
MILILIFSIFLNIYQFYNSKKRRNVNHSAVRIVIKNAVGKRIYKMNLKVNDSLPLAIQAEDEFGNPTQAFDAPPAWSLADSTLGSVVPSADGLSAVLNPSGKLGVTTLQVLGTVAGAQISGSLALTLIAGDAAQIVIQPGTPAPTVAAPAAPVSP